MGKGASGRRGKRPRRSAQEGKVATSDIQKGDSGRQPAQSSDTWSKFPCRTFITRVYNQASATYEQHQLSPTITVKGMELYVNAIRIPPTVTRFGRQQIYWRYQHPEAFSYGYLNFHHNGHSFHGMYATGASPSTATLLAIQGVVLPSTYSTMISKNPSYDPKSKKCSEEETDDSLTSGPDVEIGFTWGSDGLPKQIFKVGGKDLNAELQMDSVNHFIINEDLVTDKYADSDPYFPVAGEFTLAPDSKSFTGSVTLKQDGKNMANFCWNGKSTSRNAHEIPHVSKLLALPKRIKLAAAGSEPLSVIDLFTLCHAPPSIQKDSQNMMMDVMKYVIGAPDQHPDWLQNFFGEKRPILAPALQQAAKLPNSQTFYTNFATPYIGIGLYQSTGKGIPHISILEGRTMLYYFQNGLAKEPGYTEQANALYLQAFLADKPRLQAYLDDQNERKHSGEGDYYWAEQLHAAVLDPDNINNMVSAVIHSQGDIHQQLRDYGSVLNLLQPSGELAQDAYTKLLTAVFGTIAETMDPKDLKDKIAPWVTDFIQGWVDKFDKGEPPTIDKKEHLSWETAEAFKEAAQLAGHVAELANQITDLIVAERVNNIYERSSGVGNKLAQIFEGRISETKLRVLKRGVITAVHVTALFTTIQAFTKWKEVPTEQKVALVAETVELGVELLIDLPEKINDVVALFRAGRNFLYRINALQRFGNFVRQRVVDIAQAIREFLPEGAIDFVIRPGNFLEGLFKSLPRVLSIIAPLVSLIVVIANIITLIKEPDAPIQDKIFSIIQIFAGVMETFFLAAGLVLEELLFLAGPFAILGVVVAIIQVFVDMFYKPKPPPSPSEKFYNGILKNHIAKLTTPPDDFDPDGNIPPSKKFKGDPN